MPRIIFFLLLTFYPLSLFAFDLDGTVRLEPPFPEPVMLQVPEEHQAECGKEKLSPKLRISPEGFVADAVIELEGIFPGTTPLSGNPLLLDQKDCEFSPHVLLVPRNSEVTVMNSEPILHDVRAFNEKADMLFNDAMPAKNQKLKKKFTEPGRIVIRCGIHKWMHALAVVTGHPYYALSDASGHFKIEGIPEGNYTLRVWHESLGELRREVHSDSGPLELSYPGIPQS